jgi:OOP family OmpA-OmpF porin
LSPLLSFISSYSFVTSYIACHPIFICHAELDSIAAILVEHPQANVNIVGHTDSSGSEAYNQKISEDRANAVSDYLQEKGVKESQINASGEGESNPIATNKTAEGRSANRRVDIDIPNFEY